MFSTSSPVIRFRAYCAPLLFASVVAAAISACGGGGDPVQPSCTVSAVSVSPASATVAVGATSQLTATPTSQNCSPVPTATWSTSAAGVATVSTTGLVSAVATGSATITATVSGVSSTAAITVTPASVATITLTPATSSLVVGGTVTIAAVTKDAVGNTLTGRTITLSTSNAALATVSTSGLITALAAGNVTITATSEGQSGNVAVTVQLNVSTVTIVPATLQLLPLATSSPTATVRAADNSVLTGRVIAWTSSDATIATVNASTGLITAVAVGTATITATVEGIAGTLSVNVVPTIESSRYASIWADQAAAAVGTAYTPSVTYSQNAAGGANSVTHTGVGTYAVVLGKMAKANATAFRENIFVTAYGSGGEYCRVGSWGDVNTTDLGISVACFDINGAPANSAFDLALIGSGTLAGRYGFMWNSSAAGSVLGLSAYSFSTGLLAVGSVRASTGLYAVTLGFVAASQTAALVSTYSENTACNVDFWDTGTGTVTTRCTALTSTAQTDSRFTVMLMESGRAGKRWGFAWANSATATLNVPYTPSTPYQNQSNGQQISVTRTSVGLYTVTFTGMSAATFNGTMLASAYANGGAAVGSCQVTGWSNSGSDVVVGVKCWSFATKLPADQLFVIVAIE